VSKNWNPMCEIIKGYKFVFWDFDGVIKDSVDLKTAAFTDLFPNAPGYVLKKISKHHLANGGMSRFEKIPLYLEWAGLNVDDATVANYCSAFSKKVCQAVIHSKWVPGVLEYLKNNHLLQRFVLITGTPQIEIKFILSELNIDNYFCEIYGSPHKKDATTYLVMNKYKINPKEAVFIGDSLDDFRAATINNISFILRLRGNNLRLFGKYDGLMFESLI